MECRREENLENCNCSYPGCPRKGMCCDCVKHHREIGELPGCFFEEETEKTYERSVEKFIESRNKS